MTTPAAPPWDGSPAALVEYARQRLALSPTDPDLPWLGQLADAVIELVDEYIDTGGDPFNTAGAVNPSLTTSCVLALVDAYRRKDVTFGVIGVYSPDGTALRVSRDWLDGVKASLQPHRVLFGIA